MSLSRTVYRSLGACRVPWLARTVRRGAPVFCFHNVVPDEDAGAGDASLHMAVHQFESIIDWLRHSHDVVPLSTLVQRIQGGQSLRGLAGVTFDDAYRGVFEHALPVLAGAGIPSTVFIVSRFADAPAFTWWDILASRDDLSPGRRARALKEQKGLAREILPPGSLGSEPQLPTVLLPASWDQILPAAEADLMTLGSHTMTHGALSELDGDELAEELVGSLRAIAEKAGQPPEAISYPYGMLSGEVAEASRKAGYQIGTTLSMHLLRGGEDPMLLPRLNVPAGIPIEALDCWSAGIRLR